MQSNDLTAESLATHNLTARNKEPRSISWPAMNTTTLELSHLAATQHANNEHTPSMHSTPFELSRPSDALSTVNKHTSSPCTRVVLTRCPQHTNVYMSSSAQVQGSEHDPSTLTAADLDTTEDCPICYMRLAGDTIPPTGPDGGDFDVLWHGGCRRFFHQECLSTWVTSRMEAWLVEGGLDTAVHVGCPMCRGSILGEHFKAPEPQVAAPASATLSHGYGLTYAVDEDNPYSGPWVNAFGFDHTSFLELEEYSEDPEDRVVYIDDLFGDLEGPEPMEMDWEPREPRMLSREDVLEQMEGLGMEPRQVATAWAEFARRGVPEDRFEEGLARRVMEEVMRMLYWDLVDDEGTRA